MKHVLFLHITYNKGEGHFWTILYKKRTREKKPIDFLNVIFNVYTS